jgi:hypothetical protein
MGNESEPPSSESNPNICLEFCMKMLHENCFFVVESRVGIFRTCDLRDMGKTRFEHMPVDISQPCIYNLTNIFRDWPFLIVTSNNFFWAKSEASIASDSTLSSLFPTPGLAYSYSIARCLTRIFRLHFRVYWRTTIDRSNGITAHILQRTSWTIKFGCHLFPVFCLALFPSEIWKTKKGHLL